MNLFQVYLKKEMIRANSMKIFVYYDKKIKKILDLSQESGKIIWPVNESYLMQLDYIDSALQIITRITIPRI